MSDPSSRLDDPAFVTRLFRGFVVVCILLLAADLAYEKHGHYGWENLFGFHGFFGFAAFIVIVLAGKQLRKLISRDEDYYDR